MIRKNPNRINQIKFTSKNDLISIKNLLFENFIIKSFDKILVKTFNGKTKNNDFAIIYGKKIKISGSKFDARNLIKLLDQQNKEKTLSKINGEIVIDLANILTPVPEELTDFKLIGIHCQLEGYKLAFNLNKSLNISLEHFDYSININKFECVFEIWIISTRSAGRIDSQQTNLVLIVFCYQ